MTAERLYLFDTTLRDGAQTAGIDFSVEEKIVIAELLERLGVDYVEGGYPGANPTDTTFFEEKRTKAATFTAFGMTKRAGRSAANDPSLQTVLGSAADAICLVAKSWDYHVRVALGCTNEETLAFTLALILNLALASRPRLHPHSPGDWPRGDDRLRAFLRRLQGQSGLCAGLREDRL